MVKLPKLPTILAGAFAAGFAALGVLNIIQFQRSQDDKKLMQGQITDLQYQVKQDMLAAGGASPTPAPAQPAATPDAAAATPQPVVAPPATPSAEAIDTPTPAPATNTKTVKTPGNVHQSPNASSAILIPYTKLAAGTVVALGAASGQYQQITVNGITGYILATDLQ